MKNSRIGIVSLGCPRNLVDSESILGRLDSKGYRLVDMDKADIGIVNTCSFIEDAKKESIDAILDLVELKKEGRLKKIIVCGCLSQRYKDALVKELPEVDAFVGRLSLNHSRRRLSISARHYAYLKICEGCVNRCSFCIIPKIKGRFSSLDMESILEKADALSQDKVSEINVIGQDISGYGLDLYGRPQLDELLPQMIKRCKDVGWIRLLYLNPSRISDKLLEIIGSSSKVCRYIDLPIQHINDRILKLMNRRNTKKEIASLIDKIRRKIPGVALRSSLIVGFPSETDREFKELLKFVRDIKFERLGAFVYSREEGTAAYDFKGQLPENIKIERLNVIMEAQQEISSQINKKFLGKTLKILVDEKDNQGKYAYLGRSEYDAPEVDGLVYINSQRPLKPGDFVKVKITDTLEYDLAGESRQ